jgi:predicted RNase H-like HicB family nuclease
MCGTGTRVNPNGQEIDPWQRRALVGGYFVTVPALPGCPSQGRTVEECQVRAVEAIEVHISGLRADLEPIPEEIGTLVSQLLAFTVAV